jgi:two-component system sensor histidine kinase BaeS
MPPATSFPTDLPYLFERFYRGEKSRSRRHGGAGIGLSIVKELVEAHGGKVHAEMADGIIHIGFTLPLGRGPHRTLSAR